GKLERQQALSVQKPESQSSLWTPSLTHEETHLGQEHAPRNDRPKDINTF
ncbi:hypothetical protein HispidOSU_024896, partial [Sigmodon hispidus]